MCCNSSNLSFYFTRFSKSVFKKYFPGVDVKGAEIPNRFRMFTEDLSIAR